MNLLYSYPVFMPMPISSSSGSSGEIPPQIIWAILIVVNAIGLIALVSAWLLTIYKNKGMKRFKYSILDTIYNHMLLFELPIGFQIFVDIVVLLIVLVYWVATLI